jgi:hypothetical protein
MFALVRPILGIVPFEFGTSHDMDRLPYINMAVIRARFTAGASRCG